jgi:hypothetical protein
MPQKMLFWPPFATSLPQKSDSKVASTQSKQGNNEWGVEVTCFSASWRGTSSLFRKAGKRAEIIRTYGKV